MLESHDLKTISFLHERATGRGFREKPQIRISLVAWMVLSIVEFDIAHKSVLSTAQEVDRRVT